MEYYLCGGGAGTQVAEIFSEYIGQNAKILYIPLAMNLNKSNDCKEWFSKEVEKYNVNFYMVESNKELNTINLNSYSHVFIGGGNTYKLLKELKEINFFKKLKDFNGKIWGGSAGAIIFGKDINSCKIEDENNVGLTNTKGMNIVEDYSLICHLNKENFEKNTEYLKRYSLKYKTIYLSEDDVIYIKNNKIKIMGDKPYIIFEHGKYDIYNE